MSGWKPYQPAFGSAAWQEMKYAAIIGKLRRGEYLTDEDNDFLDIQEIFEKNHFGTSNIPKLRLLLKHAQETFTLAPRQPLRRIMKPGARLNPHAGPRRKTSALQLIQLKNVIRLEMRGLKHSRGSAIAFTRKLFGVGREVPPEALIDQAEELISSAKQAGLRLTDVFIVNIEGMTYDNPPAGGGRGGRPPQGAVLIGRRVKGVEYYDAPKARAEGLENPNMPWRHDYKTPARVYGLPDGSVLIKGKKKLWGYR